MDQFAAQKYMKKETLLILAYRLETIFIANVGRLIISTKQTRVINSKENISTSPSFTS